MIAFICGIGVGIIATIGVGIAIIRGLVVINWPEPKCEPQRYSAIGSGPARTTGPELTFDFIQRRLR